MLAQGQPTGTVVPEGEGPHHHAEADELRTRRGLVNRLSGRLDDLAKEMADAYVALAGKGGRRGSTLSGFRAAEAATEQLLYLLRAAATGDAGEARSSDELEALAGYSAELARAGCTLADVLDVCNASFLVAWDAVQEELAKLPASPGATVGPQVRADLLAAMTRSTVVVSEVFQDHLATADDDGSVLRCALKGAEGLAEATRRARAACWPVEGAHTVVVVTCERADLRAPRMEGAHQMLLEALAGLRVEGLQPLTCLHHGSIVVAVPDGSDAGTHNERWRHVVAVLSPPPGHRLLAGAGLSEKGFEGVPVSYGQARRALEVAAPRPGLRVVVSYGDVLPELLLLDNPTLADNMHRLALVPLARHPTGADELLASLEVYLDLGLNAAAAAQVLGVHRHTLSSRLQQVERLTGLRIDDGDQRMVLELALRARRHHARPVH